MLVVKASSELPVPLDLQLLAHKLSSKKADKDLPGGVSVTSLDWSVPILAEVRLYTIEVQKWDWSPPLLIPEENLSTSQRFVSFVSSKQPPLRVSWNLKNIFPVPTTDHLSAIPLWVSEQVKRLKYLSCYCLGKCPYLASSVVVCTPAQMIKHFRYIKTSKNRNRCTVAKQVGTAINQIRCLEWAVKHLPF